MKGEKLSEINNQMFEILLEIQELKAQCFSNRQIKVMIKHKHFDQKLAYDDDKLDELNSKLMMLNEKIDRNIEKK